MRGDLRNRRQAASAPAQEGSSTTSGAASGTAAASPRAKIDKSGLYDLQQVKRLLDDEIISVRICALHSRPSYAKQTTITPAA